MNQYFTLRRVGLIIPIFTLFSTLLLAQNTSNKGTDFWIGYTGHINGGSGTGSSSQMNLYITSDVNTSGTVSIPLNGWSMPFTVTANNTTIIAVPPAIAYDGNSGTILNQGINVTSVLPVVVYSHIYASDKSDATLALPVPTLGKEYYTMGFKQQNVSGGSAGYAEFMVVGVQDSTQVQITPTATTTDGHAANVPFTITINQGQVYQLQSTTDLTGSHIVTFSNNNSACNRIAVFSGSTYTALGCANGSSGDNLYQQLYPVNAWGNDFVTAPFKTRKGGDYFRVLAGSDSTLVSVNGETPYLLNTGQYHDTLMATPNYITATKPVTLAQYQRTQNCDNVTGDPSMTILSPIEQTLDTITLYSTKNYEITGEYINVIIKSNDTAMFRLDGNHVPFSIVPANALYSYSQNTVAFGNHFLTSDSGFNAIAYGFGQFESYGYSAGANVKSLVQYANANSNGIISPHILCNGSMVKFTGVVSYIPASIKWYFGDGDTSTVLNPVHTYGNQGTYVVSFVTVNGSAGNSCDTKDSSTYTLNIVGFPVAGFTFINTCVTDTVSFIDGSTAGGGSIVSWKWNFGDGDSSSIESPSYHYASAGTYNVQLVIKSNGGCTDTITQPVTISPQPNVNAGPDRNMCFGSSVTLSTTTGSGYTFQWSPATSLSCSTCSSTTASPADTQLYVIETTLSGCSAYDTVEVNVVKPVANIPTDTFNICIGGNVLLSTDTLTGQTYSWSPVTALSCSTCSSTNASPSVTTKYFVTSTLHSCTAKDSAVVKVITPHAGPSKGICSGGSINLTATPGGAGVTYTWTPDAGLSCTNCQSPVATPPALPATYYVTISSSVCTGSDSVILTLITVPANAGKDDTVCVGKSTVLSASGGVSYTWDPSTGLSTTTGANPTASPAANTTYTVIVTDTSGCTGSSSVTVSLFASFPNTAGPDTSVCIGDTVHLKSSGGVAYLWQPGKLLSDSTIANPLAGITAAATYTVTITSSHDCDAKENVTIGIFDLPFIIAGPDTVICQNKPLQLTASGANTYQWSGGDILSCGSCATVTVGTENSGVFTVTGIDLNGCKNTASATVVLSQYCHFVLMPSAFTPDNDGHNDLFRPVGKGIVKVQYSVYNRWGKQMFTGDDLIKGWDGKYNGVLQPIDTYVWYLTADMDDGTTVKEQGNVTLIR